MKTPGPGKVIDFLSGGGEMGERIRNFDWSKTSLGDPDQWDQSLKTIVHIMLTSSQPIWIGWGRELVKLYNDPYKAIVGGKHPQALGQPASVVWKDIWSDIKPMLDTVMTKDEGTYVESQLLIMERYGYPEETYYTFSYTPVLGNDGKPAGMICYNTADTERRINERSLQTLRQLDAIAQTKSENEIYELAAKAIATNSKDFPFAILYKIQNEGAQATLAAYTGFNAGHAELQHTIDLINPDKRGKNIAAAVKEGKLVESKNNGRWKDLPKGAWNVMPQNYVHVPIKAANKKFPLAILTLGLNPYRKFDNVFRNFVQLIADQISFGINNALAYEEERKRAEALEELDKAKTIFFSNISHEFRTPLTLMLGTLEEVMKDEITALINVDRLQITHRNAMRLLRLVNSLLDFSRIESGRQKANYVHTDIAAFTKNLSGNFRSIIEKAGLKFNVEIDAIHSPVYVDREMWEKIVFNLLSNAFKYTLKGSITLRIFETNKTILLEVADTGVGIPEEELPQMFERFHRVQNTVGRTYEGTGIGLSLTKELVQLHGGSIAVKSKAGEGSCFTITLPSGKEHLAAGQVSENETAIENIIPDIYFDEAASLLHEVHDSIPVKQQHDKNKATILVADDNPDMRRHVQLVLEKHFNVITAANGLEALEKIKTENPQLVLSDIMMPVMDGIQLLKEIKGNPAIETIPVILLTARAGEESKIEGWETGADDYLVKPFSSKELIARISAQIRIKQKRDDALQTVYNTFNAVPFAVAVLKGKDFVIEFINQYNLDVWQRKAEDVIGKPLFEARPDLRESVEAIHKEVYSTGKRFGMNEIPVEMITNGEKRTHYFNAVIDPLFDDEGKITGQLATSIEVTEQAIARKKIEESEERFRMLANEAPLFVWLTDENLYTTFLNQTGLNYFNIESIQGLSWKKFIHQDDIDRVLAIMNNASANHKPYTLEMRLKNGDTGQYRWFLDKGVPRYHGEKFIGFIGTSLDIDDRKESEKILRESEERFRTLTEALPQLVLMTDANGAQQFASKNWVDYAGFIPKGEKWPEVIHPDDMAHVAESWLKNIQTGNTYKVEVRLKNKEGEYRWHFGQGEPIKDNNGNIINWIGAFTDIHDRKTFSDKLKEEVAQRTFELERSNKELESFNYIASHDLQEPLRKIQTFILLLEKSLEDGQASKKYIDKIITSAQRMGQLIQSVLDYSRLSQQAVFEKTDLNKIIENVKTDYELLISEKNAVIICDKLPIIKAVPLQMQQLFSNLLSNSLKFCKTTPVINVTSKIVSGKQVDVAENIDAAQKFAEIKFSDNGIGFESQYKEQIFKLFQRLHNKSEYSGTGVGLSIVSKIVESHKGFIKAESKNNDGATFTVWLPVD